MKICFFCSSSESLNKIYYTVAEEIVFELRKRHWTLVSGGTKLGLMRLLVENAAKMEVKSIGVMPSFFADKGILNFQNNKLILTKDLMERKKKLLEISDAFVILPGGYGTLDEMFEVLTLKSLNFVNQPVYILNHNNFYDELLVFLDKIVAQNFSRTENQNLFTVLDNVESIFKQLDNLKSKK